MTNLIIIIGSGRCGTQSLANVLNQQPSCRISHEKPPFLPWEQDFDLLHTKIESFKRRPASIVGDAAFYYLPYIDHILSSYREAKVVCLKREKDDTVKSFLKWTHSTHRWLDHDGSQYCLDRYDKCYPKFDIIDREQACRRYWELYYQTTQSLMQQFPDRIRLWSTEQALNTEVGLKELLSFVGISSSNQNIMVGVKQHASCDGVPRRTE